MKYVTLPIIENTTTQMHDEDGVPIQRFGVFPEYQVVSVGKKGVNVENVAGPGTTPLHEMPRAIYRSVIELTSDREAARHSARTFGDMAKSEPKKDVRPVARPWETVTDAMRKK
jgi:hypothetical protein